MPGDLPQPTELSPATDRILTAFKTGNGKVSVQSLDRCISELLAEVHVVRSYRNALSFPNHLPIELLGEIFLICRDQSIHDEEEQGKAAWLKFTHVCRHWREVALNQGPLWSNITFAKTHELTKAMLARSRNLPLTVRLRVEKDINDAKGFRNVLSQAPRLRFVKLVSSVRHGVGLTQALSQIGNDTPNLEELELLQIGSDEAPFPACLLQGNTPKLKRLTFRNISMSWGIASWPANLTHLKISQCRCLPHELSRAVSSMSSLMTLDIFRCLTIGPPFSDPLSPNHVSIPNLKALTLNEPAACIRNFFSSIRIPQVAHLSVISHDELPNQEAVTGWLGQAKESLRDSEDALNPPAIATLNMWGTMVKVSGDLEPHTATQITFHRTAPDVHPSESSYSPPCTQQRLDFSFDEIDLSPLQSLTCVRDTFPLTTLTSLRLEAMHHLKPEEAKHFYRTCAGCPALAEVCFKDMPIMEFLVALGENNTDDTAPLQGTVKKRPPYPKLNCIAFSGINWRERAQHTGRMLRRLIEIMDKRPPDNSIERLCFTNCRNASRSDIDTLKHALPAIDIVWEDGVQSIYVHPTAKSSVEDESDDSGDSDASREEEESDDS